MTISVTEPGLPAEQPGTSKSAGDPETSAAFLALLTALLPQALPAPAAPAAGTAGGTAGGTAAAGPVGGVAGAGWSAVGTGPDLAAAPVAPAAPQAPAGVLQAAAPTAVPATTGLPPTLPATGTPELAPTTATVSAGAAAPAAPALATPVPPPAGRLVDPAAMQAAGLQTAVLRAAVGATSPAVMTPMTPTLAAAPAAVPEAVPADPAGPALPPPAPGRPEAQAGGAASATGPDATAVPALSALPTAATAPADVAAVVERTPGKLPSRDQAETVTPATASGAVVQPPPAVQAGSPVAAAAPVTAAPPAMHLQVLHAVSPVVHGPDGSYSIQLQLAPNDLGQVQVTVDMADGRVSIHLHADDPAAGAALRDSLPQLREQLEQQGLSTGNLDVGSGDAQRRPRPQNTQTAAPGGVSAPVPPEDPVQPTRAAHSAGALDVRM